MNIYFYIFVCAVTAYIIGSLPFGIIVSKLFFGFDIRTKGSGNMGSTNVIRVIGLKWGILVQLLDLSKGYLPVIFIPLLYSDLFAISISSEQLILTKIATGISAVLGHIFTVFAGFKGGKGVNTATGMLLAIIPADVGIAALAFAITVIISGFISLGSLIAAIILPLSILIRVEVFNAELAGFDMLLFFSILVSFLIFITHRANIKRLLHGNENKFRRLQLIRFSSSKNSSTN